MDKWAILTFLMFAIFGVITLEQILGVLRKILKVLESR
jgi:hypothetical protein